MEIIHELIQYTHARLRVYKRTQIIYLYHQFEKVEWNKLVRAEIASRKYVLGQQRKFLGNERQTEFVSAE